VVRRIAERLVDVPGNVRVKGDHLADGHAFLLCSVIATGAKQSSLRSFSMDCRVAAPNNDE
jgi:hypothetical protein